MKKFMCLLVIAVIVFSVTMVMAQPGGAASNQPGNVSFGKAVVHSADHGLDSLTFRDFYYFDVPEGVDRDSCQMLFWCYSTDGAAHLIIRYWTAFKLGSDTSSYKWSPDSTTLSADWSTELDYVGFRLENAAKDTTENGTDTVGGTNLWPDAYRVLIGGYTGNQSDTKYALKLIGIKPD